MLRTDLSLDWFRSGVVFSILATGLNCGQTLYGQCEDEREEARICQVLVIQNGVIAAEARRQSQNLQQSDILIDGLPIAAGVLLCKEIISSRCEDILEN
jgi:hypothetical protein